MKEDMIYQKNQDETKYKTGHKCLLLLCFSNHKGHLSIMHPEFKIQTQTENFNFSYQRSF